MTSCHIILNKLHMLVPCPERFLFFIITNTTTAMIAMKMTTPTTIPIIDPVARGSTTMKQSSLMKLMMNLMLM